MNPQTSAVDHLLGRIDPAIAASFSASQRQALETALTSRRHPVDIRLSMPWIGSRIYLVLLAGGETRSAARRRLEAHSHPLWKPLNLLIILGTIGTGVLALLALLQISAVDFSKALNPEMARTGIPFKADQASCEQSGRIWEDDACFDYHHDPTF